MIYIPATIHLLPSTLLFPSNLHHRRSLSQSLQLLALLLAAQQPTDDSLVTSDHQVLTSAPTPRRQKTARTLLNTACSAAFNQVLTSGHHVNEPHCRQHARLQSPHQRTAHHRTLISLCAAGCHNLHPPHHPFVCSLNLPCLTLRQNPSEDGWALIVLRE